MGNHFNPCSDVNEAELPLRHNSHVSKSRKEDLILKNILEKKFLEYFCKFQSLKYFGNLKIFRILKKRSLVYFKLEFRRKDLILKRFDFRFDFR